MNLTIWKATLKLIEMQDIEVPAGAEMLCAREQYDQICVWFRCDPNASRERRTILIVGTGHPTAPAAHEARYIGTASLHGGQLIFHIFERF